MGAAELQVSLDGGRVYQPAPKGVRVRYGGVSLQGKDDGGCLLVSCTHEELVFDLWSDDQDEGHLDTSSVPVDVINQ